jgi:hypothetical protein
MCDREPDAIHLRAPIRTHSDAVRSGTAPPDHLSDDVGACAPPPWATRRMSPAWGTVAACLLRICMQSAAANGKAFSAVFQSDDLAPGMQRTLVILVSISLGILKITPR